MKHLAGVSRPRRVGGLPHSGQANLSVRVDAASMLLTVQGQVRDLQPDGLVYRARPEVGGIIHTHSPHLLAFAMAGRPLPDRYEALLRFGQAEEVPVVPWAPRGSQRSVSGIIDALEMQRGTQAVLLANHGDLVFGRGPQEAAALLTVLEEAAEAELAAAPLGGTAEFPPGALEDVRPAWPAPSDVLAPAPDQEPQRPALTPGRLGKPPAIP